MIDKTRQQARRTAVEGMRRDLQQHNEQIARAFEVFTTDVDALLKIDHVKVQVSHAILSRGFWGRVNWLLLGR